MNRSLVVIIALSLGAGLCWFFPLFRIVPLEQVAAARGKESFDAAAFTQSFWEKHLVPNFELAHEAIEVLNEIKEDPAVARKTYGRSVGIGRSYFYFIRGEGTILSVTDSAVAVDLIAPDDQADVSLKTGLLFGNTIRDATGQLQASDYANSQDYNDISTQLNRIVEQQVLPALRDQAEIGRKIRFVGCAEVRASSKQLLPLTVVPLRVEFPK